MFTKTLTLSFALLLTCFSALASASEPAAKTDAAANDFITERSIGSADAPVTMTEYFSFTCSHCAEFAVSTMPKFKERFVDTGKVRVIFRDFPLDIYAKKAAMMARCTPKESYYDIFETIFNSHERWTGATDPDGYLIKLGSLVGINSESFKSCTTNPPLDKFIIDTMQEAQTKRGLTAVPTFIFNDGKKVVNGYQTIAQMEKILAEFGVKVDEPKADVKK